MTPKTALPAVAAALAAVLLASCSGEPGRVCVSLDNIDAPRLLKIMRDMDLEASEETVGTPPRTHVLWNYHGLKTYVLFMSDGEALQFYVGVADTPAGLEDVNSWNTDYRYSRSYLDGEGDPVLELDLDFAGGICEGRVRDWLETCKASLDKWYDMLPTADGSKDRPADGGSRFPGEPPSLSGIGGGASGS
ncbi:MAG: YbjN domain-containing protein [Deltaproteobacteria bacterium]|jgi:hypothetical protein|nr:YbjN domain-containing protein [Deltaproteobacteria bacterium]